MNNKHMLFILLLSAFHGVSAHRILVIPEFSDWEYDFARPFKVMRSMQSEMERLLPLADHKNSYRHVESRRNFDINLGALPPVAQEWLTQYKKQLNDAMNDPTRTPSERKEACLEADFILQNPLVLRDYLVDADKSNRALDSIPKIIKDALYKENPERIKKLREKAQQEREQKNKNEQEKRLGELERAQSRIDKLKIDVQEAEEYYARLLKEKGNSK